MPVDIDLARRHLLTTTFPLAAIACLGCRGLAAQSLVPGGRIRSLQNRGMTTEEAYAFFYGTFIPLLQSLAQEMGRERFLAALTQAASDNTAQMITSMAQEVPARDARAFSALLQNILGMPPFNEAFAYEIVEESNTVVELKFTSCLPARLLRSMNAADIGYAIECSGSAAGARAFNPRMRASNPNNMMRGDAYCIERFALES